MRFLENVDRNIQIRGIASFQEISAGIGTQKSIHGWFATGTHGYKISIAGIGECVVTRCRTYSPSRKQHDAPLTVSRNL